MQEMLRRYGSGLTFIMCLLVAFWLLAMVVVPNIILLEFSFRPYLPMVDVGGPKDVYSFDNYLTFFSSSIHIQVFFKTVIYSSLVTAICLIIHALRIVQAAFARRRGPLRSWLSA